MNHRLSAGDVGSALLAHDDVGSGSPVVFVHGFCSSRRVFGYQLLDLATDHRVLAVDLPGFGDSGWEPGRPWFEQAVDRLVALIGAVGIEAPLLVGWSLGGSVVTAAASRIQGARTVLVGSSLAAADERSRLVIQATIRRDFPRYLTALVRRLTWSASVETEQWLLDQAMRTPLEVAHAAVLSQPDLQPVALVGSVLGRHDALVQETVGEVVWFEQSGHSPFIEEKDRFGAFLRSL